MDYMKIKRIDQVSEKAKSSTWFYVGRIFQEDEFPTHFVRLTDDFSSKKEAIEWIESMMEEVEMKGVSFSFYF
jgi:hypothetical protein